MKLTNRILYIAWGALYGLCAVLGCITAPNSLVQALQFIAALLFYVPGAILLYRGIRDRHAPTVKRIRSLSILWLVVMVILMMLNISSTSLTRNMGYFLHYALVILCAPIGCIQYWMLSVFFWGCLLFASFMKPDKK